MAPKKVGEERGWELAPIGSAIVAELR